MSGDSPGRRRAAHAALAKNVDDVSRNHTREIDEVKRDVDEVKRDVKMLLTGDSPLTAALLIPAKPVR